MAKILVVDDNDYTRMILKGILVQLDYDVVEAKDAQGAYDSYMAEKPDAVMMDVILDVDEDGIDVARRIIEQAPDAKIIMCSAQRHNALKERADACGAIDYIVKPFDLETIRITLDNALN